MRYKLGWLIADRLLALTHFEPVVTADDMTGIAAATQAALQTVTQPFHILVDNRIMSEQRVTSLELMLELMPLLNHPQLRWMVVVLPERSTEQAQTLPIQQVGQIRLIYVPSLEAALRHLETADATLHGTLIDPAFFHPVPPHASERC